jgi:hypothetical protein
VFFPNSYAYHELPVQIFYGINEISFRPLSETSCWIRAIRAAFALRASPEHAAGANGTDRDTAVAYAAKSLQSKSYKLAIDGARFYFEPGELERCCANVSELTHKIGGASVIAALLRILQGHARFVRGRYLVGRNSQIMSHAPTAPSIPFGYLLNLSLRHMNRKARPAFDHATFKQLLTLASDLVAVADVETYSTYAFMSTNHSSLPRYLEGITLGDFCLTFRQIVAQDALEMMRGLFNWIDASEMERTLGWSIKDAIKLAEAVLSSIPSDALNAVLDREYLVKTSGCSNGTLTRMLPQFTHSTTVLNARFLLPTDTAAANFDLKPFIWQPGDKTLLLSPPLCSIGFIEALISASRVLDKNADSKIGTAIEPMLAEAFRSRGIEPVAVSEKYVSGKKIYDCDLAVVSTDAVILFEIKKKALTKASMAGGILEGLSDLCRSMIKAQTQLGKQEIELRKSGEILFQSGVRLELGNRRVERIAVTLLDWGSMQDRLISDTVLETLATASIEAKDLGPEDLSTFIESRDILEVLRSQTEELCRIKGSFDRPFFDCFFLGVPQILFLLNGTHSTEEFHANLKIIKHSFTGTLDMFQTLIDRHRMKASLAV